jgi:hypothetical protein
MISASPYRLCNWLFVSLPCCLTNNSHDIRSLFYIQLFTRLNEKYLYYAEVPDYFVYHCHESCSPFELLVFLNFSLCVSSLHSLRTVRHCHEMTQFQFSNSSCFSSKTLLIVPHVYWKIYIDITYFYS